MTYYSKEELHRAIQALVEEHLGSCIRNHKLSKDCVELIKHNFQAKFVHYNDVENMIEIGVEDFTSESNYPEIKVIKHPLDGEYQWLKESIRTGKGDLAFYGRLLEDRRPLNSDSEIVVM
jgi:hypothetical protein